MRNLQHILSDEFIEASGWMLVHSLWQGLLVLLVLSVMLWLMRRNSAQLRYLVSYFFLLVLLVWSGITFVNAYQYAQEKTQIRAQFLEGGGSVKAYLAAQMAQNTVVSTSEPGAINFKLIRLRGFLQQNFYWFCAFWILGMTMVMLRMAGGLLYMQRLRTYGLLPVGEDLACRLKYYTNKLNLRRKVVLYLSPLAKVPLTLGTFKPVILFPFTNMTGLSADEVEAILVHELAHVLRHDYLFNIVQSVVEMLFFYHPAVWIISAQIRNERENCCDSIAIELTGDKLTYVKALAAYEKIRAGEGDLAMAFARSRGSMLNRIKRIQKQVAMKTNFTEGLIAAAVVVFGLALVSFTMGNNNLPDSKPVQASAFVNTEKETIDREPLVWTTEMIDSVEQALEENIQRSEALNQVSEEMKKMVEVAMSEQDKQVSAQMMEELNSALSELDLERIISDALKEVQFALEDVDFKEIQRDIEKDFDSKAIRRDMEKARRDMEKARREIEDARSEVREEMRRDMRNDGVPEEIIDLSVSAAETGLNIASSILENLPLDEIVHAALEGVGTAFRALDEIDFDTLLQSVESDLDDSISAEDIEMLKLQMEMQKKELEVQKKELEVQKQKLELQKELLKQKEKELKRK